MGDPLFTAATEVLRSAPYVVVATHTGEHVQCRQVQLPDVNDQLDMVFGTSPRPRKVADIRATGRATVVAEAFERFAYVSIATSASVVDDPAGRRRRWIAGLAEFFPAGPDGDDFVLVHLRAEQIELMDFSAGITPDPYGLRPAKLERAGDDWQVPTE